MPLRILKGHKQSESLHAMRCRSFANAWISITGYLFLRHHADVDAVTVTSRRACVFEGFYDAGATTMTPCPGALPCDLGFYCTGGKRFPCPAGSYGDERELRTEACSGPCPAGFYCPIGTATPIECGSADVFCPLGSSSPRPVPEDFYSIGMTAQRRDRVVACDPGFYCSVSTKYPCPAGTYGSTSQLSTSACTAPCPAGHYCPKGSVAPLPCPPGSYATRTGETDAACSGLCRDGFYCPQGSISATTRSCGTGNYCRRGSGAPQQTNEGQYVVNGDSKVASRSLPCPTGSYCTSVDGAAELCPAGTFGDRPGLATPACSGLCSPGYYCPEGSTTATAVECGGADIYCPSGSPVPVMVSRGYYTTVRLSLLGNDQDSGDATTRSSQRKCEPGHFCVDGVRTPCPAGTFGVLFGLENPSCSGLCQAGYYCPARSIVATAHLCGSSDFYCPAGSAVPARVDKGYCSTGGTSDAQTRTSQRQAEPGEFAFLGSCYPCPAGTYGIFYGETDPQCSGACSPGYYCPPGSSSPTQKECGSANVFCPRGSKRPLPVDVGYYTTIDTEELCPPGRFRDFSTTTCQFIEIATGRSPVSVNYGDSLYPLAQCSLCPADTFKPAYGDDSTLCVSCPTLIATSSSDRRTCECFRLPGGVPYDSSTYKLHFNGTSCDLEPLNWIQAALIDARQSLFTRHQQFACEKGFYCQNGIRKPCPAGFYGDTATEIRPQCSGQCAPGFFCPLASINSTAHVCGDASVYCPSGSAVPRPVTPGYYTIRSPGVTHQGSPSSVVVYTSLNASANVAIRDAQLQCERGYYCVMGMKFICSAGRYGDQLGETSPLCAGLCKRGYYCPAGSVSASERECGGNEWICRTGSPVPVRIPQGYYSLGLGDFSNTTRYHQQPCEPGFFCVDGVKYQCPAGTFGSTSGLSTPQCSGLCRAGYYCPSYPYTPSTSETQIECGNSTVYCPVGSGNFPKLVTSGYYSIGAGDGTGDARNTTRTAQQKCPKGSYCRGGIRIRCPEGTYGDREGLTSTQCSGWCPAGFFCPPGTADYKTNPCPLGTFAIAGSASCMPCGAGGGNRSTIPATFDLVSDELKARPCVDKRECCFFG